jgi:tetratricopeptide (TPR) repeat protein
VEAGDIAPGELAAVFATGNALGRFDDVASLAELALGTPTSVVAAAEAAAEAAARAEERRTGEAPAEPPPGRMPTYAGLPTYIADARLHNEAGVAYFSLGRVADAHEHYLAAIAADPTYDEPHVNLGVLYRRKGWYEKALAEYERALELRPTNATTWYNRAVALLRLGRAEEATAALETSTRLDPKYPSPLYRLATLWYDLGDYETARDYAQRLVYLIGTDESASEEEAARANEILTLAENRLAGRKAEPALTVEGTAATPPGR